MKHVFIIGSKGIPANYGGFETFVDRLTAGKVNTELAYHVACMDDHTEKKSCHGAECMHLAVPQIGPAKAVCYDLKAFRWCIKSIRELRTEAMEKAGEQNYDGAVIYVLACRIGPFFAPLVKKAHALGAKVFVNPDGHEWKRAKWNVAIRKYWKFSEKLMVKSADLMVCDSKNIESYIREEYGNTVKETCYIAYGADMPERFAGAEADNAAEPQETSGMTACGKYQSWLLENGLEPGAYALVVGRFVPENNYETMIREYLESKTEKPLVLITNVENNEFYNRLKAETGFDEDKRIRFAGTVYDRKLLTEIRKNAWVYLHGHEVGGTNPSLLEALAATEVNLLLDVGFNREVAESAAMYWTKEEGSLRALLERAEALTDPERVQLKEKAEARIRDHYSWEFVISEYEKLFMQRNAAD